MVQSCSKKHIAFGHALLLLLLLSIFPLPTLPEKLVAAYLLSVFVAYGVTGNLPQSAMIALLFVLLALLLDPPGSHRIEYFEEKKEEKKKEKAVIPGGEDTDSIKPASDTETQPVDTLTLKENELEDLLKKDHTEKKPEKKETFTGIPDLDHLLKLSKKDADEHMAPPEKISPAQAQRQTHQIIDTVKQLKETMESMMPLLTSGKQIMDMYKALDIPEMGLEKKKS